MAMSIDKEDNSWIFISVELRGSLKLYLEGKEKYTLSLNLLSVTAHFQTILKYS